MKKKMRKEQRERERKERKMSFVCGFYWDRISLGRIQNSNIDLETTDFVFDIIKVKN